MKKLLSLALLVASLMVANAAQYQFSSFINGTNLTLVSLTNAVNQTVYYNTAQNGSNYAFIWYDGSTIASGNTNSVGQSMGFWSVDVPLTSLADGNLNTNVAFSVSGVGSDPAAMTNTVAFTLVHSADGVNFDTNTVFTLTITCNGQTPQTTTTNLPGSFLVGMQKLRVNKIVTGSNAVAVANIGLTKLGIGRFVP